MNSQNHKHFMRSITTFVVIEVNSSISELELMVFIELLNIKEYRISVSLFACVKLIVSSTLKFKVPRLSSTQMAKSSQNIQIFCLTLNGLLLEETNAGQPALQNMSQTSNFLLLHTI